MAEIQAKVFKTDPLSEVQEELTKWLKEVQEQNILEITLVVPSPHMTIFFRLTKKDKPQIGPRGGKSS